MGPGDLLWKLMAVGRLPELPRAAKAGGCVLPVEGVGKAHAAPWTTNIRLRTGTDKGNPTV